MIKKTVDLSFELINIEGKPVGIAALSVARAMESYIKKMERRGNTEIVVLMRRCQNECSIEPYHLNLNNAEFDIVYNWLINFSGFYDTERGQPLTMIKNAFESA